jgi:hypothetical protein
MQVDVNVVLSEFVIINLYIMLLKSFSDIRSAGDRLMRRIWDVEAKLIRSVCWYSAFNIVRFVLNEPIFI